VVAQVAASPCRLEQVAFASARSAAAEFPGPALVEPDTERAGLRVTGRISSAKSRAIDTPACPGPPDSANERRRMAQVAL